MADAEEDSISFLEKDLAALLRAFVASAKASIDERKRVREEAEDAEIPLPTKCGSNMSLTA